MTLRLGRSLPPAAAPLGLREVLAGLAGWWGGSATLQRFETELADEFKVRHCLAVSSGSAALVLILRALAELNPDRDEVLIPAYTCYTVPGAVLAAGLKVRLCDLAPGRLDYDYQQLERHLESDRLLCVVSTHLFGVAADVARVKRMAAGRGIAVVEDAAQAMGWDGTNARPGTAGDVGLFSLGRGKAFSTVKGGIILTDDQRIGHAITRQSAHLEHCREGDMLRMLLQALVLVFFIHPRLYWLPGLLPFLKLGATHFETDIPLVRFSPFQAGLARGWRERLKDVSRVRNDNAAHYARRGMQLPAEPGRDYNGLIRFPLLMATPRAKEELLEQSGRAGLGISAAYPDSIDRIPQLAGMCRPDSCPVARDTALRLVTLPIHQHVRPADREAIVRLVADHGGGGEGRLLKNSHLAAVLESPLVRRSAATSPRDFLRVRRSDYF